MAAFKIKGLPESRVVQLWLRHIKKRRRLTDSEGGPVEVVYPGRPNDGRGADFRDAVISSGAETRQGCIEFHSRSSGWQAHGHHLDPVYNEVVLHVAWTQDSPGPTVLQNGKTVPTIILGSHVQPATRPGCQESRLPCSQSERNLRPKALKGILDLAGDRRFQARAARFEAGTKIRDPGQSLYQGMAEALGYSKNQIPFRELSRRVPLRLLRVSLGALRPEEECLMELQAILLGSAGLLPSQRELEVESNEFILQLERNLASGVRREAMSSSAWELFKVRPGNYPVGRIIALSHWLCRFRRKGLFLSLIEMVRGLPAGRPHIDLESALLVTAEGYWASHYDFGLPSKPGTCRALLGRERASAVIINVILPFIFFWSQKVAEPRLGQKAREIFEGYPRLGMNSIEQHMLHQLAISPELANSARRQQGLIHLYKAFCTQGKCGECDLARGQ